MLPEASGKLPEGLGSFRKVWEASRSFWEASGRSGKLPWAECLAERAECPADSPEECQVGSRVLAKWTDREREREREREKERELEITRLFVASLHVSWCVTGFVG
jgi:hypothetical protein